MAASPHEKLVARWASDEELFTRVWNTLLKETHKSVSLSVARDLLLSRYANQGVDRRAFYAVCPELNDEKIARFVVPELLPKVINVRVAEPEACTRHDRQFVQAQLSNAGVENSNLESTLISRRQDIMHSFFIDVMTVVTKYLAQQSEASAQTEADTPQSNETAASSASTTKSEETTAPRGDSDAHDLDETNLPIIAGMHHAAIICSDYEVSKTFYVETLGFKIIAENFRKNRNSWKLDLAVGDGTQIELFRRVRRRNCVFLSRFLFLFC